MREIMFRLPVLVVALALAANAHAEKADRSKPTHLTADKATTNELTQVTVWAGNAELVKGTLQITAERIEFRQDPAGYSYATAIGSADKPARFRQKRDKVDEFVEGQAERLDFDGKADTVIFSKQAVLRRADPAGKMLDELRGAKVVYNNQTEIYDVTGGSDSAGRNGRVTAIIAPRLPEPQSSGDAPPAKP
jgi:lipopolysaccharide export system protein LptA